MKSSAFSLHIIRPAFLFIFSICIFTFIPSHVSAATWTPVLDDTFNRADTVATTTPNSTAGVGNNWTDTAGGSWNILNNQLQGYTTLNADYLSKFLARPTSESATNTRVIVNIPANENLGNAILGVGLRKQASSDDYYMGIFTTNSMWIYRNIGGSGNYFAFTFPTFNSTHAYSIDFSAVGTYPTVLSLTVTDLTASTSPQTLSVLDNSPSLQYAGVPTLTAFNNGGDTVHATRVQTFVNTDVTVPQISGITVATTTQNTATITWNTDVNSVSEVDYGTSNSYDSASSSFSFVTSHSVTLTNLTPSTTYHFQVSSISDTGNQATSTDYTFTTTGLTPIGYWKFDEVDPGDDAVDEISGNNGIQTNAPYTSTDVPTVKFVDTGSRGFDGSNYFTINRPVQDDFTICAWIKTTSVGNGTSHWLSAPIMDSEWSGRARDFGFGIDSNGHLMFGNGGVRDSQVNGSTVVNDDAWHNVCVTRNKTTGAVRLYVDSALDASGTTSTGVLSRNPYARIGYGFDSSAHYTGLIDDLRVYNAELNSTQILNLFQGNSDVDISQAAASSGGCSSTTTTVGGLTYTTTCGVTTVSGIPTVVPVNVVTNSSTPSVISTPLSNTVNSSSSTSAVASISATSTPITTVLVPHAVYQFNRNLKRGMSGDDVLRLQQFLNTHGFEVSSSGRGSSGYETNLFGSKTEQAVMKLQAVYLNDILSQQNFAKPTGWFYTYTRGLVNKILLKEDSEKGK